MSGPNEAALARMAQHLKAATVLGRAMVSLPAADLEALRAGYLAQRREIDRFRAVLYRLGNEIDDAIMGVPNEAEAEAGTKESRNGKEAQGAKAPSREKA